MPAFRRAAVAPGLALTFLALGAAPAQAETVTFTATGGEQFFSVPAGVTSINVVAVGAKGGAGARSSGTTAAGFGARATADLAVTPGQVLFIEVGTNGAAASGTTAGAGGFNGGGAGGDGVFGGSFGSGGGGGATDVRTSPASAIGSLGSRVVIAGGGGGGGGAEAGGPGGPAGGDGSPGTGFCTSAAGGGKAGTAGAGGDGGTGGGATGGDGFLGGGGAGGEHMSGNPSGGGGGGGGVYGGGGGAADDGCTGSGGGGGGGGASGFGPGTSGTSVGADAGGVPSVTLTYTAAPGNQPPANPGNQPAPPLDTAAPVMSSLNLSPSVFEAANIGGPIAAARVGTRVVYELSEAGRTTFTVERAARGYRKGRRCVARKPRGKARRCTRYVRVRGSFTHDGVAGVNRFRYTGRLRGRSLRPGSYRLVATTRDAAGNRSKAKRDNFRIVR